MVDIEQMSPGVSLLLDDYVAACPSAVRDHQSSRNVVYYAGSDEPYVDISIFLQLAWRYSIHAT